MTVIDEKNDSALIITRIFAAPREQVFQAWTDPAQLMRWFAPKTFTAARCSVDLRPGGAFHFTMRAPDGMEIHGVGIYREIVPPERLVYVDSFADADGHRVAPAYYGMSAEHPADALVTVTFEEHEGGTKLTLRHELPAAFAERSGVEQGWNEMIGRLGGTLEES